MLKGWLRAAWAMGMLLTCMAWAGESGHVDVSIDRDGSTRAAYRFAPGTSLRFTGEEAWQESVRKAGWKSDPACFTFARNEITLGTDPRCARESIALDWDDKPRDRMYPPLIHLRNGGVLLYAAYLEVLNPAGKSVAEFRLHAPPGGIVSFRERKSSSELVLDSRTFEHGDGGWFYFGPDRFVEERAARVLADDGVAESLEAVMNRLAPQVIELYASRLGAPYAHRPTFYLTWIARERPGRTQQADLVPGGEVRFGVIGSGWRDVPADALGPFETVVAHELAHMWNMGVFKHPPWAAAWLHEGNSELLATSALLALGKIDDAEASKRISNATVECGIYARGRAWKDIREREAGRYPYACGMALQFAIVAAARRDKPALDAFGYWRDAWKSHPTYYEAVFEQEALARGDEALASVLRQTLTSSLPLIEGLKRLYALAGLRTAAATSLSPSLTTAFAGNLMGGIMRADCHGTMSVFTYPDYFHIEYQDELPCQQLRSGLDVVDIAGVEAARRPIEASQAVARACASDRTVALKTRDGETLGVACPQQDGPPLDAALIEFDPAQVAPVLDATRPRPERNAAAASLHAAFLN